MGGTDGDAGLGGGEAGRVVTALVGSGTGAGAGPQVRLMDEIALRVQEDKGVQKKSAKAKFGLVAVSPTRETAQASSRRARGNWRESGHRLG